MLISVALVVLSCSYCKDYSNGPSSRNEEEEPRNSVEADQAKIVVIMAGDEKPTYIATPALTITTTSCWDHYQV